MYDPKVQHAQQKGLKAIGPEGIRADIHMGWNTYIRKYFAICGHREDDNNDHSRAVPAGSAYTDEELERGKMKDKAFFQQGKEPMQIGLRVHAGAKK